MEQDILRNRNNRIEEISKKAMEYLGNHEFMGESYANFSDNRDFTNMIAKDREKAIFEKFKVPLPTFINNRT